MPIDLEFKNTEHDAEVRIEDDGKVAYAYLLLYGKIVGDIWLYNVGDSPVTPEWTDKEKIPFSNPKEFVRNEDVLPIQSPSDVTLEWGRAPNGDLQAVIYLRDKKHALLCPEAKPGWCRLAAKAGPLAKPLDDAPSEPRD